MEKPAQKKIIMALVCWLVGVWGVHRFMMGHKNWWVMLLTFGGCGIWALIDLIQILMGKLKMADGRDLL